MCHHGAHQHLIGPLAPYLATAPLERAGWTTHQAQGRVFTTSPDTQAVAIQATPSTPETSPLSVPGWQIGAGRQDAAWWITFSRATPTPLIGALTTAMTDPTPTRRHPHRLPAPSAHITISQSSTGPSPPPARPAPPPSAAGASRSRASSRLTR
ncbi:DUF317 domain-containing protein [Streptomyces triticirhizae]|uniref:DUF317 domain-containing protein n=1 Tax=Streptomyces triticirhizae TaxID=2483353 RepID=A0A3M2MAV0_9ACTN|nr:DUF317 domain-containing protein [Streptomyces triticirhizae]